MIHCRYDEIISGPSFFGFQRVVQDTLSMWAPRWQESNDVDWEEVRQRRAAERKSGKADKAQPVSECRGTRSQHPKLSRQLNLNDRHRQNLLDRGLSDDQIRAGLFLLAEPWQKSEALILDFGVSSDGNSLLFGGAGISIPIGTLTGTHRLSESTG